MFHCSYPFSEQNVRENVSSINSTTYLSLITQYPFHSYFLNTEYSNQQCQKYQLYYTIFLVRNVRFNYTHTILTQLQ